MSFCAGTPTGPHSCEQLPYLDGVGPASLTVADVDGDGYGDIIAGVRIRRYYLNPPAPPGTLVLLRGGPHGPRAARAFHGHGESRPRDRDGFGSSIAAADLDRDGYSDVVVGSPGSHGHAGEIVVLRGAPTGRELRRAYSFDQASPGVPGRLRAKTERPFSGSRFGAGLATLNADGDRFPDLAAGVLGHGRGRGAIVTLRGGRRHFSHRGGRLITPRELGLDLPDWSAHMYAIPLGSRLGRPGSSG
jgi:hypothetical protein